MLDNSYKLSYNNKVAIEYAAMAQEVERILGKDEVTSSTLVSSSKKNEASTSFFFYLLQKHLIRLTNKIH